MRPLGNGCNAFLKVMQIKKLEAPVPMGRCFFTLWTPIHKFLNIVDNLPYSVYDNINLR